MARLGFESRSESIVALICDGELGEPRSDDPDLGRLQISFYDAGGTALTLRKNLKSGLFETLDKAGNVKTTYATFALALGACKADALTNKAISVTDAACDHTNLATRKSYCPTYEAALLAAVIEEGAL